MWCLCGVHKLQNPGRFSIWQVNLGRPHWKVHPSKYACNKKQCRESLLCLDVTFFCTPSVLCALCQSLRHNRLIILFPNTHYFLAFCFFPFFVSLCLPAYVPWLYRLTSVFSLPCFCSPFCLIYTWTYLLFLDLQLIFVWLPLFSPQCKFYLKKFYSFACPLLCLNLN